MVIGINEMTRNKKSSGWNIIRIKIIYFYDKRLCYRKVLGGGFEARKPGDWGDWKLGGLEAGRHGGFEARMP